LLELSVVVIVVLVAGGAVLIDDGGTIIAGAVEVSLQMVELFW
jgi:hypothetical protein